MLEPLCNVIEEIASNFDVDCRRHYSGRFMYGVGCMALTGDLDECMGVVAAVISTRYQELIAEVRDMSDDATEAEIKASYDAESQVDREVTNLCRFKMDSMGHGSVIYWPAIVWTEDQVEQG